MPSLIGNKVNQVPTNGDLGTLAFQDGVVPTGSLVGTTETQTLTNKTIDASQLVNASVTAAKLDSNAQYMGFKNRIINGAMMIDQRNAGASVTLTDTSNGQYLTDRWYCYPSQASKLSAQQNAGSVTPPTGFTNYLGFTSLSSYSVTSSDAFFVRQGIEGFNTADLGFGTANASTVTLSFWVRSSLTGTFGGSLRNAAATRSYPYTYTINSANTWEQKTITIAGDTSGTWVGATNGAGMYVFFGLGVGSNGSTTAGAWATGNYSSATGATSVVGTNGATFYITGVQLEKGSTATSFDYRPYGTELQLCQRYYQVSDGFIGMANSTVGITANIKFVTTMRASPSVNQTAILRITDTVADYAQSGVDIGIITGTRVTPNSVQFGANNFTGLTNTRTAMAIPSTTGLVTLSAEL
jgi:hypothetical protein